MSDITGKVVVVEDEGQIRRFVCDALRREGCAAVEAATARQGLDAAAADKPDLVLLDLGLPDMSGLAFIGALTRLVEGAGPHPLRPRRRGRQDRGARCRRPTTT